MGGRKSTAAILIAALLLAAGFYHFGTRPSAVPTSPLEALRSRLKDDKREFILVNFWASWCGPCFRETPSLIRFAESRAPEMAFVTISQDTVTAEYDGFRKIFPRLFTVADLALRDADHALGRQLDVNSLPVTFIYSTRTRKMLRLNGSLDWDEVGLMDGFRKSLGGGT